MNAAVLAAAASAADAVVASRGCVFALFQVLRCSWPLAALLLSVCPGLARSSHNSEDPEGHVWVPACMMQDLVRRRSPPVPANQVGQKRATYTYNASERMAYRTRSGTQESNDGWASEPSELGLAVARWNDGDSYEVPGLLFSNLDNKVAPKSEIAKRERTPSKTNGAPGVGSCISAFNFESLGANCQDN